jgi:hypothetical protein
MKMEQREHSEMSAYKIQMPGNYPEESIKHFDVVFAGGQGTCCKENEITVLCY